MVSLLEQKMQDIADRLNKHLDSILPKPDGRKEDCLFEAMRYMALSKGKRIRPFLCIAVAELFGVTMEESIHTAAAIEIIHCYSMIHDDLPAMDNDDFRRGQPSCHKKYDEATAILTGDALLTLAFEMLSDPKVHPDSTIRVELISTIAKAIGYAGMVGGQMLDILLENATVEDVEIVRLQCRKTGDLFEASCMLGAILGKANKNARHALKAYANNIGLAFQIADDLLDAGEGNRYNGKIQGGDANAKKATLVSIIGIEKAKQHSEMLVEQAIQHLASFNKKADLLKELAKFVVNRVN